VRVDARGVVVVEVVAPLDALVPEAIPKPTLVPTLEVVPVPTLAGRGAGVIMSNMTIPLFGDVA
jgi:hypothetical protein